MKKAGRGRSSGQLKKQRRMSTDYTAELPRLLASNKPGTKMILERWNLVAILNRHCPQGVGEPMFNPPDFASSNGFTLKYVMLPDDQLYVVWLEEFK